MMRSIVRRPFAFTFTFAFTFAFTLAFASDLVADKAPPAGEHPPAHEEHAAPAEHAAVPDGTQHKADAHGTDHAAAGDHAAVGDHAAAGEHGAEHAEHHDHHPGITNWWAWSREPKESPPFGFALLNFAIFVFILRALAWKPLKTFVLERHENIKRDLTEAAKLRAEAETKLKLYESKVLGLDQEIDALIAGIRQEAEADRLRMVTAAEEQSGRIKAEAERQVSIEIERARRMLKEHVVALAVSAAEEILKKNVTSDDQRRIAERYVETLEKN